MRNSSDIGSKLATESAKSSKAASCNLMILLTGVSRDKPIGSVCLKGLKGEEGPLSKSSIDCLNGLIKSLYMATANRVIKRKSWARREKDEVESSEAKNSSETILRINKARMTIPNVFCILI